jgi:F0F1-type ATP synthase membrane subunit c/vacuolar-type H+-ATPase subunit K
MSLITGGLGEGSLILGGLGEGIIRQHAAKVIAATTRMVKAVTPKVQPSTR